MILSIFGLGYVGCVSAACLARCGHTVIGVDVNETKVSMINNGFSPIVEKEIGSILKDVVNQGNLKATSDHLDAIAQSEISFICVGTPSNGNGSLDLDYITRVCRSIGEALKIKDLFHLVVVRSTVLPGSVETKIIPIIEECSGKKAGNDFGICMNPEFLREGSSVHDFLHPPVTLIGELDQRSGRLLEKLYAGIDAPIVRTAIKTAEMVKYANNAFHGLKVSFANEIGNLCKSEGIDSHEVMKIFSMDRKLNLSPYYLKPGFSFGGSCLPKDINALVYRGRHNDLHLPVLESIIESNDNQTKMGVDLILTTGKKRVGILGMSFKDGTDDLRESPMVRVIETLIGKGYSVRIYDKNVSIAKIFGANKEYIEKEIPHISSLMCSTMEEVLDDSEVVVIGNKEKEFESVPEKLRANQVLIDFIRITNSPNGLGDRYRGICW